MNDLDLAIKAAATGAAIVRAGFGKHRTTEQKGRLDPVTEVDRASEAAIVDLLTAHRPGDGLLGEEGSSRTSAGQTSLVRNYVNRLLAGFDVTDCSVTGLSDEKLQATVQVRTSGPMPALGDGRLLTLGDGPVSLGTFPMPLARSARRTDVQLAGAFSEKIDLAVILPDGSRAKILPAAVIGKSGEWGSVAQTITAENEHIRILRELNIGEGRIRPEDYAVIREAMNALRAEASRRLLYGP